MYRQLLTTKTLAIVVIAVMTTIGAVLVHDPVQRGAIIMAGIATVAGLADTNVIGNGQKD